MKKRNKPALTRSELRVLRCLILHRQMFDYAPTVREICHGLGWTSPNAAWAHLVQLRQKGCIAWITGKSRTFTVLPKGRKLARAFEKGSTQ